MRIADGSLALIGNRLEGALGHFSSSSSLVLDFSLGLPHLIFVKVVKPFNEAFFSLLVNAKVFFVFCIVAFHCKHIKLIGWSGVLLI